jgi:hypothetical protein
MASTYLTKTFGSAGSLTTWTLSFWVKKAGNGIEQRIFSCDDDASGNNDQWMKFDGSDIIQFSQYQSGYTQKIETNRKFRDNNGYYHIVLVWDTTNSTAADRTRLYVNGVRETSFSSEVQASSSLSSLINNTTYPLEIGRRGLNGSQFFTGSLSHVHFIDGTAYNASAFGSTDSTTGEWKINTSPSVTYGTNGFTILKDGNTITDQSANSNNFTLGGGTLTKTEDCPSNVFATLNPLHPGLTLFSNVNFLNGNTTFDNNETGGSIYPIAKSTLAASQGKYYAEFKQNESNGGLGISDGKSDENFLGDSTSNGVHYRSDGNKRVNNVESSFGDTYTTGDIIGIAMDLDNNYVYFSKNGIWQDSGDPTSGANGTGGISIPTSSTGVFHFAVTEIGSSSTSNMSANFGNGYFGTTAVATNSGNGYAGAEGSSIFNYQPPTGFTALSTKGLNL